MSKIQEALARLQSDHSQSAKKSSGAYGGAPFAKVSVVDKAAAHENQESSHGVVAHVDREALRKAGLVAPDYHEKLIADQFRDIKRPLIANAYGKRVTKVEGGNLIMVTSALPADGKTFTSLNLAISISQEQDLTVLLIDADVAKPHISTVLGLAEMPGLLDLLHGEAQGAESLVVPTDLQGLSILPAGAPNQNATEMLSSSRMEDLVQQLAARFPQRVVLFDTPPLLQTSESKVLASMAGQIVLVVRAESTSQGAVAEALQILGEDKIVNLVLNQSTSSRSKTQYGYGYGRGFGESN